MIKENYSLFLFDFDGLLVDTEVLHYQAYKSLCACRGFSLDWDLMQYYSIAHSHTRSLGDEIYASLPDLKAQEPRWDVLYKEKTELFQEILNKEKIPLKDGAEQLLNYLQELGIPHCVVTNSYLAFIERIRTQHEVLQRIPVWFTREDTKRPKPEPDPYLLALKHFNASGEGTIGFEDTMKGLRALQYAGVQHRMLVCPIDHPQLVSEEFPDLSGHLHIETLFGVINTH